MSLGRSGANLPLQGVLFDLDGTLLDTEELILISMRYATQKVLGETISDAALMQKVGQPLEAQMKDFTKDLKLQEQLLATYRTYNHEKHDAMVSAYPGTREMLEALRAAGMKLGVVTSKRHALAQRGLEVCGIDKYFTVLVGSDDFAEHKPAPGPVIHGCELLGVQPGRCLYVGDSPFDMQAGHGAGCRTAAALWGFFPQSVLERESPMYLCHKRSDVVSIIDL